MKEVLLTLLSLTLSGSLLCVLLLLLRPVMGNRVPRAFSYYLWLAVLLRFLIPLGYGIHLPEPSQPTREAVTQETLLPHQTEVQTTPVTQPTEQAPAEQGETPTPSVPVFSLTGVLFFLWLAVGAGFLCWHIAAYVRFSRRIRASLTPPPAEALALFEGLGHGSRVRLACSGLVDTPMLLGVFRPVIVLPQGGPSLPPQALSAALLHELTHARRGDICYKWLVVLVTSLHWFNPLVHWMGRRIALDCELACDQAVIRSLEPEQRMAYGDMLLLLAARPGKSSPWMAAPLCQEGKRLKARLLGIKGYQKPGKAALCLTLVLGLAVTCCACGMVDLGRQQASPAAPSASDSGLETDPQGELPARYEAVLLGDAPFLYGDGSDQPTPTFLPDIPLAFSPYSSYAAVTEFAVLDLDGDGSQEVVLQVTDVANDMGGYVVLRQDGDEIYGYPSHWRTFWQLKTDGTFTYSSLAGTEEGVASVSFVEEGLTMEPLIRCELGAENTAYEVDHQPVSEAEYETALKAQTQKPDAVWHELNEANISQLTA